MHTSRVDLVNLARKKQISESIKHLNLIENIISLQAITLTYLVYFQTILDNLKMALHVLIYLKKNNQEAPGNEACFESAGNNWHCILSSCYKENLNIIHKANLLILYFISLHYTFMFCYHKSILVESNHTIIFVTKIFLLKITSYIVQSIKQELFHPFHLSETLLHLQ